MARRIRASLIETRTARLKLDPRKKPYEFTTLAAGIALGYRRTTKGSGSWVVRSASDGTVWTKVIGIADDFEDANGDNVLTFFEACDRARNLARGKDGNADSKRPVTWGEALDDYERSLKANGGDPINASRVRCHLTPTLLNRPVALLTSDELERWRENLLAKMAPATVERTLKSARRSLTLTAERNRKTITNQMEWKLGLKAVKNSRRARHERWTDKEINAVIDAAYALDPALGLFVETMAETGARQSQIAKLEVADLQGDRLIMPTSNKGKDRKVDRRPVPITPVLAARLRAAAEERSPTAPLLLRSNGKPWSVAKEWLRPFASVAKAAGVTGTMYALRHSSIIRSLLANVPIRLVAVTHDTSVAIIEQHYSHYIDDHADAIVRRGLLNRNDNVVSIKIAAV